MKHSLRFSPVAGALLCLLMYPAVSASVDRHCQHGADRAGTMVAAGGPMIFSFFAT